MTLSPVCAELADLVSLASVHECVRGGPDHRQTPNRPAGSKGSTGFHVFCFCARFHVIVWRPGT